LGSGPDEERFSAVRVSRAALSLCWKDMNTDTSRSQYRPSPHDKFFLQLENAAALHERGFKEFADKLIRCAEAQEERIKHNLSYASYRCDSRYCLYCSWRDAQENVKKYIGKFERLSKQGFRFSQLALTILNEPRIGRENYSTMFDNYRRLQHRKPLKDSSVGSLAKLETTFNTREETYHPHIQALLVYKKCAPQEEIMNAWTDLASPYFNYFELSDYPARLSTHIEKVKGHDEETIREGLTGAIKYLSKPITFPTADAFVEYFLATRRMPLMRSYGMLRGRQRANSHYLDIRGVKSASDKTTSDVEFLRGGEAARARARSGKVWIDDTTRVDGPTDKQGGSATLGHTQKDENLIAAQRRLLQMRQELEASTETAERERQNNRIRTSVECPDCRRIMPPSRVICKQCEADAQTGAKQEQSKIS
jgi:hypothetical protein